MAHVQSARMHLHWQQHPGRGPHLLLVHGFLSSARQWEPNLAALGEVCQPVTLELWGHNKSPAPKDPTRYQPAAYLEEFEHIRRQLGCAQWFLCGYSLGAGLTIAYALAHPQQVLGHAFTNSTSGLADSAQIASWQRTMPGSADQVLAGGTDAMARLPVHPLHAKVLPEPIKQALVEDAQQHSPLGIANTLRFTNPKVSVRDQIAENTRPSLLLWGQKERRFSKHQAFAAANMPLLEVAPLDAGHGVNMEATPAFNKALTDFVAAHSSPSATVAS